MLVALNSTVSAETEQETPSKGFRLLQEGRYVYERNCQVCHGRRGDGRGEWAASLLPRPRSFRAGEFKYRSTAYGKLPTDADLARTIRQGRSNTAMGMFAKLSDRQVSAVINYLKTFSRKFNDPDYHGEPLLIPPTPSWFQESEFRSAKAVEGRELFQTTCAPCHGAKADGKGPQADSLTDSAGRRIMPANLLADHLRCGDTDEDLVRLILTGMSGTPMLGFAETFTDEQIWELVAFLQRLRASEGANSDDR